MRPASSCSSVSADGETLSLFAANTKSNWKLRAYESRVCRLAPRWRASVSLRNASMRGAIGVMIASLRR